MTSVRQVIEENLGHGRIVFEEAKRAGYEMALNEEGRLDIADACALVDHESIGGQNIFGCDFGGLFCNEEVTRERLDALLAHIDAGGNSNGVGLTQITSPNFIFEAEARGGAHLPEHQCSVGFEHLAGLVDRLGFVLGIAAYNVGEGNPQFGIDNGYFGKVMAKREKWKELLAGAVDEEEVAEPVTEPTIEGSETVAIRQVIMENLGHGRIVFEEAKRAGYEMALNEEGRLDIADACALVDHESIGGQNIFGCDFGGLFCNEEVTRERLDALLAHIDAGGNSNGVGLTQITSPNFIFEAEARGGAHLPEHQCSVGFEHLAGLVDRLGFVLGIAAYNVGEGNPQFGIDNGYFGKVMVKREKWKALLAGAVDEDNVAR
jgi:hypothetical protein